MRHTHLKGGSRRGLECCCTGVHRKQNASGCANAKRREKVEKKIKNELYCDYNQSGNERACQMRLYWSTWKIQVPGTKVLTKKWKLLVLKYFKKCKLLVIDCQWVGSSRGEFRILPTFDAQSGETRGFNMQDGDGEIRQCDNTMCIQCRHSNHGPGAQKIVVWLELDIWLPELGRPS